MATQPPVTTTSEGYPLPVTLPTLRFQPISRFFPHLIGMVLFKTPKDLKDRFIEEGLLTEAEIGSIERGYGRLGLGFIIPPLVFTTAWIAFMLRGGGGGHWTKQRRWDILAGGAVVSATSGFYPGYELGLVLGTDKIYSEIDPRVAPLKVLTYRYMRSAGGSLPPPPEPLFTTSGMPNYPIARQPDYFRRVFRYADAKITGKPIYPDQQQQGQQAIVVPAYDDNENGTEGEKAEAAVPKIISPGEAEIKRLKKKAEKSSNLSKADEERERRRELIEHLRQEVDQLEAEGREAEAARKKATLESLLLNKKQSSWW